MTTLIHQHIAQLGALRTTLWSIYLAAAVILPLYHVRPILKYLRGTSGIGDACVRTEATQCLWRVPALMYSVFVAPSLPLFLSIFLDLLGRIGRVLAMRASRRRWQAGQAACPSISSTTSQQRQFPNFGFPAVSAFRPRIRFDTHRERLLRAAPRLIDQGTTMQYTIRTHTTRLAAAASLLARAATSGSALLRAAWHGIAEAIARWRLAQWQYRGCEQLDPHALRDLGLDRSECGSYLAESSGTAESTRRRLAAPR